jgi:hypothetical protein
MTRTAVALLTIALLRMGPAWAQQAVRTPRVERVPVTVVLREPTAATASFTVLRRAAQTPRDVIVLSGPATGQTLTDAVRTLLYARVTQGDSATRDGTVRTRQSPNGHGNRRPYAWAERVVRDLQGAAPRAVSGVGYVRAVEIWLPPQRGRGRRSPRV